MKSNGILLALLVTMTASGASAGALNAQANDSKDVTVVNSPDQPVPVAGTVTLAPGATVAVSGIGGTSNVNVTGMPAVVVNSSAINPLVVRRSDDPARQSFQKTVSLPLITNISGLQQNVFEVPAGKRLIIDVVSAQAYLGTGEGASFLVQSTYGGGLTGFFFPLTNLGAHSSGSELSVVSSQTRIAVDAGQSVAIGAHRNRGTSAAPYYATDGTFYVTISGYFIDIDD